MKNPYRKPAPLSFAVGVFVGALLLGVCANSESGIAYAHGIINAFGIEYDNQVSGLVANDVQEAIDEQDSTYESFEARISALEGGGENPYDPNGDGAVSAQEVLDHVKTLGFTTTVNNIQNKVSFAEGHVNWQNTNLNGVLDTPAEVSLFNVEFLYQLNLPPIPLP